MDMIIINQNYHWTIGNYWMSKWLHFQGKRVDRPNHCISMKYRMHRIAAATFILSYPPFKCRPQMYFSDEAIKCISPLHFQTVLVNVIFKVHLSTAFFFSYLWFKCATPRQPRLCTRCHDLNVATACIALEAIITNAVFLYFWTAFLCCIGIAAMI